MHITRNKPIYRPQPPSKPVGINPQNAPAMRRIDRRAANVGEYVGDSYSLIRVRHIRPERKYGLPAHIGNAKHPMHFGRIPKKAIELEKQENLRVLQMAVNKAHNYKPTYR
jgi:hypothetical protein